MKRGVVGVIAAALAAWAAPAWAQLSNDSVKIGVATDMSSLYSDINGPGAVVAIEMAIADFGGIGARQEDRAGLRRHPEQGRRRGLARRPLVRQREGRHDPGRRRVVVVDRHPGRRRREEADLPRARSRLVRPHRQALQPLHHPLGLRHDGARQRHRLGGREVGRQGVVLPHRRLCLRLRAAARRRRRRHQGRRQGGGRGPAPDQHPGLLVLPAAGAGLEGADHRAGQCRRRHHQLDQAGGRVRHRQGRPEARRPAGLRLRRALARRSSAPRACASPRPSTGT